MFDQVKPGHVLRFGVNPSSILSPKGPASSGHADNTLESLWPTTSALGLVQCISHPSGPVGPIAADVATHLRTTPGSKARSTSYSGIGRLVTASNRVVGSVNADFVGYTDGMSNYIASNETVFSKDFSGCLMVEYTVGGQRRVAHAAASQVPAMNCKQAFLDTLRANGAVLNHGWFRPYTSPADDGHKIEEFRVVGKYIGGNINNLVTFGVVTATGQAYAIDAFKPTAGTGNDWVVTYIDPRPMSQSFDAP